MDGLLQELLCLFAGNEVGLRWNHRFSRLLALYICHIYSTSSSGQGKTALGAVEMQIPYRSFYHFIIRAWHFLHVVFSFEFLQLTIVWNYFLRNYLLIGRVGFSVAVEKKKNSKPDIYSFSYTERETDREKKESITSADLILNLTMK